MAAYFAAGTCHHNSSERANEPHHPIEQTVSASGRISDCLSLMVAGGFRHLPVVDKSEVVGVISMRDILHHFLK
eukprot:scaffold53608_cov30-Tisochrysis_lutea.AAC.4